MTLECDVLVFCEFKGGNQSASDHWIMKTVCTNEGGQEVPDRPVTLMRGGFWPAHLSVVIDA